jgi:hypothetical protein
VTRFPADLARDGRQGLIVFEEEPAVDFSIQFVEVVEDVATDKSLDRYKFTLHNGLR